MDKGVLLLALGNPIYGRMAFNLLLSLRHSAPDINVALIYEESALMHLDDTMKGEFTELIPCSAEYFHRGGNKEYFKAKTYLYDLSPFDYTIFLDADMIWLPYQPITKLFDEFEAQGIEYTMSNDDFMPIEKAEDNPKYSLWANIVEVKKAYGFTKGNYHSLHSEFIYWVKSDKNKVFFDQVKYNYDHLKVDHANFAGAIPDELPYAITTIQLNQYPHLSPYLPIYWVLRGEPMQTPMVLSERFYAFSMGGNDLSEDVINYYNQLNQYYWQATGFYPRDSAFNYFNKKQLIPNRIEF